MPICRLMDSFSVVNSYGCVLILAAEVRGVQWLVKQHDVVNHKKEAIFNL